MIEDTRLQIWKGKPSHWFKSSLALKNYCMSRLYYDKPKNDEDFPLSGGKEPEINWGKTALIVFGVILAVFAAFLMHSKGVF